MSSLVDARLSTCMENGFITEESVYPKWRCRRHERRLRGGYGREGPVPTMAGGLSLCDLARVFVDQRDGHNNDWDCRNQSRNCHCRQTHRVLPSFRSQLNRALAEGTSENKANRRARSVTA